LWAAKEEAKSQKALPAHGPVSNRHLTPWAQIGEMGKPNQGGPKMKLALLCQSAYSIFLFLFYPINNLKRISHFTGCNSRYF
jgi:hypothetical protein